MSLFGLSTKQINFINDVSATTKTDTVQKSSELQATVIYSSMLSEVVVLTFAVILLVGAFQVGNTSKF